MGLPNQLLSGADIQEAARLLRRGGVGIFPTDTVYGVGALATESAALERIYAIKGRPADKPLQLLLAEVEELDRVVQMTEAARALASRFLPGGLTLILRRMSIVPDAVTAGGETVAVRVPDHSLARALIEAAGAPVAATSANRSGEPAPIEAAEARRQLGSLVDFLLDGGRCPQAQESTIVDLSSSEPRLLREGAVARALLEEVLGVPLLLAATAPPEIAPSP